MKTDNKDNLLHPVNLLERFIESAQGAYYICDRKGTFIGGNEALSKLIGYSREEFIDQSIVSLELICPENISNVLEMFEDVFDYGSAGPANVTVQRKDGSILDVEAEMRVVAIEGGRFLVGTLRPIPYQDVRLAGNIEESIGTKNFLDLAKIMVVSLDREGDITLVNENGCKLLEYDEDSLIGMNWFDRCLPEKTREKTRKVFRKLMAGELEAASQNINFVATSTGKEILVEWHNTILKDDEGDITGVLGVGEDITERERAKHLQKSILRVLENINQAESSADLIRHCLILVKDLVECEAAGIRLRENGDYPYFIISGFSSRFVEREKLLCGRGLKSELGTACGITPLHDCVCGCVISENTDHSRPYFTESGSFWTNSIPNLISSESDVELGALSGGQCPVVGYESMALIPLRSNGEVLGLLQLNDRRRDRFNEEIISLLEGTADSIGAALGKLLIEEALRESEEKYRAIVDNIGVGISLINPDRELLSINNQMKTWFPDLDITDKPMCYERYGETPCSNCPTVMTLADGQVHESISSIKNGDVIRNFRVISSPVKSLDGRIVGAIELLEDYSDKIMMEKALDERLRFESLVSNISSRLINIKSDHVDSAIEEGLKSISEFLDADHAALMRVNNELGEFQQTHFWSRDSSSTTFSLLSAEGRVILPAMCSELQCSGSVAFPRLDELPSAWEEERRFLVERNPLKAFLAVQLAGTEASQSLIMIGSMSEQPRWTGSTIQRFKFIGEILVSAINRKLIDVQLREAIKVAEAANRGKSQFLANMSHEIRTPLNSIIGFTDLIQETSLDTDQKDFVSTIKTSGEMLLSLLNDILDFSKIDAGELVLEETEFEPARLADEISKMTRLRIGSKQVEVSSHVDDNVPCCAIGDPVRLRQVLTNLMDNAAKFTERGKIELFLSAEQEVLDRVKIHGVVTDSGIGIPAEHLNTVFELFQQGDKSMTRRFGGTGLGLSICRQIVELMEGDIWVESTEGKGSSFHFTAWLKKGAACREEIPRIGNSERENRNETGPGVDSRRLRGSSEMTRILLVEDNPVNLKLARLMLTRESYHVETACNGQEAVVKYASAPEKTDLIFMDVQMPVMDGIEAARKIRTLGHELVPIIAMTAHAIKGDRQRCLEAGMNDYITKPIRKTRVMEVISKWIGEREPV